MALPLRSASVLPSKERRATVHITHIQLVTVDVSASARFYREVLELPVSESDDLARVQVGSTGIELIHGDRQNGADHLAFTIPSNQFAEGKDWLSSKTELIQRDGEDEFMGESPWDSESVYFRGPDGIVLELITRQRLQNGSNTPFTSASLLCVSEVGLAVPDVAAAVKDAREKFGLDTFGGHSELFAAVGDDHGLLILAAKNRVWFPTSDARAQGGPPSVVVADTPRDGILTSATGWRIEGRQVDPRRAAADTKASS